MLKRKIITAASAMAVTVGLSGVATARSEAGLYGQPPCGFIEVPGSKEPGPSWRIDFKEWESPDCVAARAKYPPEPDPRRAARRQQIIDQHAAALPSRGPMESARLAAETAHVEIRKGLQEADRLYQIELNRRTGVQNWTAYKAQLRVVEELRSSYDQRSAAYISARGEYEALLAGLLVLLAGKSSS